VQAIARMDDRSHWIAIHGFELMLRYVVSRDGSVCHDCAYHPLFYSISEAIDQTLTRIVVRGSWSPSP
jgi:hypothetical protein